MAQRDDEIIMEEIEKIIDTNKTKASNLRNCVINLNQNIYNNEFHFQLIQFLGEFEYDLKTLFELFIDFKSKLEFNFQNNMNSVFSEINSLKKENTSLKDIIEKYENKKSLENSPKYNKGYKSRFSKSNKSFHISLRQKNIDEEKNNMNKQNSLNYNLILKNPNIKKRIKEMLKNRNKNVNNKNINKTSNNNEYRNYRNYIKKSQSVKGKEKKEKSNINLHPYQRKQNTNSEINFYLNKSNTSNNLNRRKFFYDYDTYLTNIKQNNLYNTNSNFIKYDNYLNKKDLKEIARGNIIDKEKKRKIFFDVFQDDKILDELKKKFGKDLERKLLEDNVDFKLYEKIEDFVKKIKNKNYYTPKIKNDDYSDMKENMSYNFKIPKRFCNKKNEDIF